MKPYGKLKVFLSINPKDSTDFDLNLSLIKIPIAVFNPYTISYTSFPLDRGTMEFTADWHVRNGNISSKNHLLIIDPRLGKKLKNEDTKWIPVPLIMSFVRERGNVIDYRIPISGNLNKPNFHLRDVVFDLVENIFVKPATIPYRLEIKNVESKIEKSMTVTWPMRQSELKSEQISFLNEMADFLAKNPSASVSIIPQNYNLKEKEYILLFEAKKKYYLISKHISSKSFTTNDSLQVVKMSIKNNAFVDYINKQVNDSLVFTIQEKCKRFVGDYDIDNKLAHLLYERKKIFTEIFSVKSVVKQVKFTSSKTTIPYNGFSFYQIDYNGEYPISLINAYNEMNQYNNELPRSNYKSERKKILGIF